MSAMYDSFARLPGISVFCWVVRLCTKTLILVSVERSVQYRERSDRMAHSTLRLNSDGWFVACAIRSLRSRYCTDRSTLTKIRVFVQSRTTQQKTLIPGKRANESYIALIYLSLIHI